MINRTLLWLWVFVQAKLKLNNPLLNLNSYIFSTSNVCKIKSNLRGTAMMALTCPKSTEDHSITIPSSTISVIPANSATPLLVLGGLGASRLVDVKGTTIWPPTVCNILADTDQWRKQILSPMGVHTLAFGDPNAFDLYPLFPFLVRTNYLDAIPRPDIACTVPYDFRQIHDINYLESFNTKLQAYIESQDKPVVILAHSTGGIVAHWFMHTRPREWVQKYIKHVVYVGVPFAGLAMTMAELIRPSPITRTVGLDILSRIGGFALNLPDVSVLTCIDPPPVFKIPSTYTSLYPPTLKFGSSNIPLEVARNIYKNAYAIRSSLSIPPIVPCTVIYGAGKLTLVGINSHAERIYGMGDGVVPAASLAPPAIWHMTGFTGNIIPVSGASHTGILFSPELRKILRNLEF